MMLVLREKVAKPSRVLQSIAPTQRLAPLKRNQILLLWTKSCSQLPDAVFCLWSSTHWVLCKTGISFSGSSPVPKFEVTHHLTNKPLHVDCSSSRFLPSSCLMWKSICVGPGCGVETRVKLNEYIDISVSTTVGFKSCQYNSRVTLNNGTTSLRGKQLEQQSFFRERGGTSKSNANTRSVSERWLWIKKISPLSSSTLSVTLVETTSKGWRYKTQQPGRVSLSGSPAGLGIYTTAN